MTNLRLVTVLVLAGLMAVAGCASTPSRDDSLYRALGQRSGIEALVAQHRVPVFGPARETIPQRTQALRDGDEVTPPVCP